MTSCAYRPLGWALVRAPLLPVPTPAVSAPPGPGGCLLPTDPRARLAVLVASRDLTAALERARPDDAAAARVRRKLIRYLIRMSTRPTPFGLFAGVGLAHWADTTDLALTAEPPRTRTRPDMAWLLDLVAHLERDPVVRDELRLVADPAVTVRGDRAWLTDGPASETSIRATAAVLRVLEAARSPTPAAHLVETAGRLPGATPERAAGLVDRLWSQGFLFSELRPPLTGGDPTAHVRRCLQGVPGARDVTAQLTALTEDLARWDRLHLEARARPWADLLERANSLHPAPDGAPVFQTDLALPLGSTSLHTTVGAEAARAADLLLRLSPYPVGNQELDGYRRAFLARYGPERQVPLLELLDPDTGLGPPTEHTTHNTVPPGEQQRGRLLLDLALCANRDRREVLELTDEHIDSLTITPPVPEDCPLSLDLSLLVAATSPAALDAGDFQLVVGPNPGAPAAGRHLGRFADLLGPVAHHALEEAARAEEELRAGALPVEVVYQPDPARSANVAIRPALRTHETVLATQPGVRREGVIPLNELVVGVRSGRFVISWPPRHAEVVGVQGHMLNPWRAPAPARFLLAAATDGRRQFTSFSWGPASGSLFLPRVQRGRVVLAPAQWRLDRTGPLAVASDGRFHAALADWRADWHVPRHVYLTVGDNRLLLDLEQRDTAEVLREELRRASEGRSMLIQEALPGPEHAWLPGTTAGGHICEIVVPLVRRGPTPHQGPSAPSAPSAPTVPPVHAVPPEARLRPPGSDWLYLKLYCGSWRQDELVAGPLRTFAETVTAAGFCDSWFFLRYADPESHLRIRFHGDPTTLLGPLLEHVCSWAADLMHAGDCAKFSFDTYEPEIERYGGEDGVRAAEMVFAADSPIVARLLHASGGSRLSLDALTLAVVTVDDLLDALGMSVEQRVAHYRSTASASRSGGAVYRERKHGLRRALGSPQTPDPILAPLLAARRAALASAADLLTALRHTGRLHRPYGDLCRAYAHMHLNRLLGAGPAEEHTVLDLLRRTREGLARSPVAR
ncbi:lantibiotic dehydratase [Streptomyces sp. PRKS01-29]|nr:lantibiotic dehydratase [Streptomyces sabulosicollis]MBI0298055.1 lantibiotic dehydratase [Streptomyces sabulosicollis]